MPLASDITFPQITVELRESQGIPDRESSPWQGLFYLSFVFCFVCRRSGDTAAHFSESAASWPECREGLYSFFRLWFVQSSGHHSFLPGTVQWERLYQAPSKTFFTENFSKSNEGAGLSESIPDAGDQRPRALPVFQAF